MITNLYTLRAGDVVEYAGQPCRVIRVTESAAVVAVIQKPRTITPRFGKPVTIQPSPKHAWISPNSEIPILNR
jgi:hypothetical protein